MRLSVRTVLLAIAVLAPVSAFACPFCEQVSLTMTEQLEQADAAVLAKWVGGTPAGKDAAGKQTLGSTEYEVVEVVRDPLKTVKPGQVLARSGYRAGKPGDLSLMTGVKGITIEWTPTPITEAGFKYMTQAPSREVPTKERLKYFVKFLEDPDAGVSADAFGEFANSKYEDIVAVASHFPRDKLREWVSGAKKIDSTRLGLYGLMLGLCGDANDAKMMEEKILTTTSDFRLGIEGVMAGYLLLREEAGLAVLEKAKFLNTKEPFGETFYAISAVRFMATYAKGRIPADRLKASLRLLLERPEIADLVIPDLARWKDWSAMDRLMVLYKSDDYNLAFRRATIRFIREAKKDVPKDPALPVQAHVAAAEKNLEELRALDPKLVKELESLLR